MYIMHNLVYVQGMHAHVLGILFDYLTEHKDYLYVLHV